MIYLNNAATSYPKPQCVLDACTAAFRRLPEGQYRSAGTSGDAFDRCRCALGRLLGIADAGSIRFAAGATDALNRVLYGMGIPACQVAVTATEHNSVLRPLHNLLPIKGTPIIVPCDEVGCVSPEAVERALSNDVRALVVNHCSNVTGCVQNIDAIARIANARGVLMIVDLSQSAGCIPVDVDKWGADAVVFTAHKSLLGVQGSGGYYVRKGVPFVPMLFGGTGRDSRIVHYDGDDYEYEVGTQNAPAVEALCAGVGYILSRGVDDIHAFEYALTSAICDALSDIPGVTLYGTKDRNHGPVVSFNIKGLDCGDTAYILQNSYGIITRAGLQCAPLIHRYIGSEPAGTVRASVSAMTTKEDVDALIAAVREIAGAVGEGARMP